MLKLALGLYSCKWGYTWEGVNVTVPKGGINKWGNPTQEIETAMAHVGVGERLYGTDYHINMNVWGVPAALANEDLAGPCKTGGLIHRIFRAAESKNPNSKPF